MIELTQNQRAQLNQNPRINTFIYFTLPDGNFGITNARGSFRVTGFVEPFQYENRLMNINISRISANLNPHKTDIAFSARDTKYQDIYSNRRTGTKIQIFLGIMDKDTNQIIDNLIPLFTGFVIGGSYNSKQEQFVLTIGTAILSVDQTFPRTTTSSNQKRILSDDECFSQVEDSLAGEITREWGRTTPANTLTVRLNSNNRVI